MRLILSFMIFAAFGFVQQSCQKGAAATKTETAKTNSGAPIANTAAADTAAAPAPTPAEEAARISLADAKRAFDAGGALFVDTRNADSYNAEHIKGAVNIPAGEFERRYAEVAKAKQVIAYCS